MIVNSQQLLYINIALGILFLIYFLFGRRASPRPTQLNLKNKDTPLSAPEQLSVKNQQAAQIESKVTLLEPETGPSHQKNLAIFFIYNGHDWEAHGVLGVPQGAHLKSVTEAYQKLLQSSDPQSYDFLEAAYKSILKQKRNTTL